MNTKGGRIARLLYWERRILVRHVFLETPLWVRLRGAPNFSPASLDRIAGLGRSFVHP